MKNRKQIKYLAALLLIFQLTFAATCGNSSNPSTDSKVKSLARIEDDIGQGLKSTASVLKSAKETGSLSQEDVDLLKPLLTAVADSNLQAIKLTRFIDAQGNLPVDKQQQLIEIISFASDQLVQLNNEGVLRIKDKNKRILFSTIVVTLQASVTSVIPLFMKGK